MHSCLGVFSCTMTGFLTSGCQEDQIGVQCGGSLTEGSSMPEFEYTSHVPVSPAEVFKWHSRPGAFERLSPPWMNVRVVERKGGLADGATVTLDLRKGPFHFTWRLRHLDVRESSQFVDEQISGPFRSYRHEHLFESSGDGGCLVRDRVCYTLPTGTVAEAIVGGSISKMLGRLFQYRHRQLQHDLMRHRRIAHLRPQRIIVTGASGLVGSAFCDYLSSGGHRVDRLVRHMVRSGSSDIYWQPGKAEIDATAMEGADVVVHLAGESLMGRWTEEKKKAIHDSRVHGTKLLSETLARLSRKPKVLISASAIGFYGDRGAERLTEESSPGDTFLAKVCAAWETSADVAAQAGIRVVLPRLGMVLSGQGGAMPAMVRPFKVGLGGSIGSGDQYVSWIDLNDLLAVIEVAAFDEILAGPLNAVSPHSLMQKTLGTSIGRVLHRPAAMNVPGPILRLFLGEMADNLLLSSQRVIPEKLSDAGFEWCWPEVTDSLALQLGYTQRGGTYQC